MFIAATTENLSQGMRILFYVLLILLPVAVLVFSRLVRKVDVDGPRTRPDLFRLPEIMAVCIVFGLYLQPLIEKGTTIFTHFFPDRPASVPKAPPDKPDAPAVPDAPKATPAQSAQDLSKIPIRTALQVVGIAIVAQQLTPEILLAGMLGSLLPVASILIVAKMRGARLRDLYMPRRVPFFHALGLGMGLGILALCLSLLSKLLVVSIVGTGEPPQRLVQAFDSAVSAGDQKVLWLISISAILFAPICEEILFRGSLYPILSRVLGRGLSAIVVAALFALAHDTFSDAPSLAVLALCFTIGYEYSGSLLVPVFMHVTFNSLNLIGQSLR